MGGSSISTEKSPRINDAIRSPEVRLIDAEGNQLGVVPTQEAKKISEDAGLDLVEVSPDANPPVCRVMNYGKYRFQMKKRKSAAKKKQTQTTIKEVKMRPGTEEGDLQVKLRKAQEFLAAGDKVKFTIRFRGREMTHPEIGMKLLERVSQSLEELGQVEQMPKFEGRQVIMIVGPKKK